MDDRVIAMNQLKVLPLSQLILSVYPDLYAIHNLSDQVNSIHPPSVDFKSFFQ